MKKFGFTLAEVLITLGIIGVVAALTAPALVQNAGTSKIGPTLAKISATLENAHEQLLHDEEATDLSKVTDNETDKYFEMLSKYVSGSSYETDEFSADNFEPAFELYDSTPSQVVWDKFKEFHFADNISLLIWIYGDTNLDAAIQPKGSFKGDFATMYVDTNGFQSKPNTLGKDIFLFNIDKSGQVVPVGSHTYAWLKDDDTLEYTAKEGDYACNDEVVTKGYGCAGSILDNNLKVIYQ